MRALVALPGAVPDRLFDPECPPDLVVLHRLRLSLADALAIDRLRQPAGEPAAPRLILCYSPYVRYAELDRCLRVVDAAIPEATALETLPRHVSRLLGLPESADRTLPLPGPRAVRIMTSNYELRSVLSEVCGAAGFETASDPQVASEDCAVGPGAAPAPALAPAPARVVTVYDVPVLEPEWPRWVADAAMCGPVVALAGFADRATVLRAKAAGASACLDLPVDPGDLLDVIERVSRVPRSDSAHGSDSRPEPAHALPPAPAVRFIRGRGVVVGRALDLPRWPDVRTGPRIPRDKPA